MTIALTHIALHVMDVSACVHFYLSYAGMKITHERNSGDRRIVWLSEPDLEAHFIMVILPGGKGRAQQMDDFSHLGFALESKEAVDNLAARANDAGILVWDVREDVYPAGYYCGVRDPDGNFVEFSYGQPLGPGAPELDANDT